MIYIYILSGIYFIIGIITLLGLFKKYPKNKTLYKSVTILIVARNEEKNINSTLNSLKNLDLTDLDWEIILVNDASTDRTLKLMKDFKKNYKNVRIINIEEKNQNFKGKKFGITKAVNIANGDYIYMTDGDCRVKKNWIKSTIGYFKENVGMLIGWIDYKYYSIFEKIETVESIAGTIFTFSWVAYNNPPYCSGGNMAFQKKAFLKVNGYKNTKNIASGDDTFLLKKIKKLYKIIPIYNENTSIKTKKYENKKNKKDKNKRKYGKNFLMGRLNLSIFIFGIIYHIILLIGIFLFINNFLFLSLLGLKFIMEFFIFIIGTFKLNKKDYIFLFPLYYIFLPFKIIYYSIAGLLKGYRWKSEEKIQ